MSLPLIVKQIPEASKFFVSVYVVPALLKVPQAVTSPAEASTLRQIKA
jgi:hypothetical protein